MNSLEYGQSPVRTFRVPDALWSAVEGYAEDHGLTTSEAVRYLVTSSLDSLDREQIVVRPAMAWMLRPLRGAKHAHEAGQAWRFDRSNWRLAKVKPGNGWWDMDDRLKALPGAVGAESITGDATEWTAVPRSAWPLLEETFRGHTRRLDVREVTEPKRYSG